jgi:hypothetical protein
LVMWARSARPNASIGLDILLTYTEAECCAFESNSM